jgi:hypothetical protein
MRFAGGAERVAGENRRVRNLFHNLDDPLKKFSRIGAQEIDDPDANLLACAYMLLEK